MLYFASRNVEICCTIRSDQQLAEEHHFALFGWDNGYLIKPPDCVFSTLISFSTEMASNSGTILQRKTTKASARYPNPKIPNDLARTGEMADETFPVGLTCYGFPFDTDICNLRMRGSEVTYE